MNNKHKFFLLVSAIAALDVLLWWSILSFHTAEKARAYFLDVGQGDSELMVFAGGATILTDAGPAGVPRDLEKALHGERYIDLAIITHPQADHFGGFADILDGYGVGAFLYNGRDNPDAAAWAALRDKIAAKHIPLITLAAGDNIRISDGKVGILSPDSEFSESAELNDTGLVQMVRTADFGALLVADIGSSVENWLVRNVKNLHADILKVAHHGSKYSSSEAFLRAVNPSIAVIEVGAKNIYGHPSATTLLRIASSTRAKILRTDTSGTVEIL